MLNIFNNIVDDLQWFYVMLTCMFMVVKTYPKVLD
jgi:hypothetical protein